MAHHEGDGDGAVGRLVDSRQDDGIGSRTGTITVAGYGHGNAFVRSYGVVNVRPRVEGQLRLRMVGEDAGRCDFGIKAAMEALVLAVGLRVRRCSKADADS